MGIRGAMVSLLAGESSISDIVGPRIYAGDKAPQGAALPHIVLTVTGGQHNPTLDGFSDGLLFIDFDIDCKAARSVEAEDLADTVRRFIDDYSGPAGDETIGAVLIQDQVDDYEPPTDNSDVGIHDVTLDVQIQYKPNGGS